MESSMHMQSPVIEAFVYLFDPNKEFDPISLQNPPSLQKETQPLHHLSLFSVLFMFITLPHCSSSHPPRYTAKAFFHKVYQFGDHSSIGGGHGRPPPLPPFSIDASDLHPEFNGRRAKYIFVRFTLR